jgi:hypothetical protein
LAAGTAVPRSIPDLASLAGPPLWIVTMIMTGVAMGVSIAPGLVLAARAAMNGDLLQRASHWVPAMTTETLTLGLQAGVVMGLATHAIWLVVWLGAVAETNVGVRRADVYWTQMMRALRDDSPSPSVVGASLETLVDRLQAAGVPAAVASALPLSRVGKHMLGIRRPPPANYTWVRMTAVTPS